MGRFRGFASPLRYSAMKYFGDSSAVVTRRKSVVKWFLRRPTGRFTLLLSRVSLAVESP